MPTTTATTATTADLATACNNLFAAIPTLSTPTPSERNKQARSTMVNLTQQLVNLSKVIASEHHAENRTYHLGAFDGVSLAGIIAVRNAEFDYLQHDAWQDAAYALRRIALAAHEGGAA